jgi:hypothetical protein
VCQPGLFLLHGCDARPALIFISPEQGEHRGSLQTLIERPTVRDAAVCLPLPEYRLERARLGR